MAIPFGAILGTAGAIGQLASGGTPKFDERRAQGLRLGGERQRTYLQNLMSGQGPSLGRQLLQSGLDRTMAQQRAMAQSARGGALQQQLARRQAQMAGAQAAGQASQQAARIRAQEQLSAAQMMGQQLAQDQNYFLREQEQRRKAFDDRQGFFGNVFGGLMESYADPYLGRGPGAGR